MTAIVLIILVCGIAVYSEELNLPGDVVVAGLFPIRKNVDGKCTDLDASAIQEAEAVKWTLRKLNVGQYIKGVTIGFRAYDTCGLPEQALSTTKQRIVDSGCSNNTILGVIGPRTSEETMPVSRLLGSLPTGLRLPQISYAATSDQLSNREQFSNFFRVIPSNTDQTAAVLALLESLKWTYITVMYDDDLYGQECFENIQKTVQDNGICIRTYTSLDTSKPSTSLKSEVQDFLLQSTEYGVSGVLIIGSSKTTQLVIQAIQSQDPLRSLMIIATEYADPRIKLANRANARGIFKIQPLMWGNTLFDYYWRKILKNGSLLLHESNTNLWLLDLYETITGCRPKKGTGTETSCPDMNDNQIDETLPPFLFNHYAIQSALILAKSIKTLHRNECGRYTKGLCKSFSSALKSKMVSIMREMNVNIHNEFESYGVGYLSSASMQFSDNGNVEIPKSVPSHEVLNWRLCSGGSFCYKSVGNYSMSNDELELNLTQVRQYKKNGDEIFWNSFFKAQCPDNTVCKDCLTGAEVNTFYIKGDMYVVVIVPIHGKGDSEITCGDMKASGGFELSEAAAYAIQSARGNNIPMPQSDIGIIIIDSCDNEFLIKDRILSLHRRGIHLGNGQYENVNDKIIGYVGGLGSGVSSAAAELLRNFGYVQISYGSTSTELSSRSIYPYFLRVTTPDIIQGELLLKLVKKLKSNYVQLIYSSEKYGEDGKNVIVEKAASIGICIAQSLSVEEANFRQYRNVISKLKDFSNARVIIVFLRSHIVSDFIMEMDKLTKPMEYVILGSEGWGNRQFVEDLTNIEGAITLASSLPHDAGFLQHMSNIAPQPNERNPWLIPYITANLDCYFEWSFNKSAGHMCSGQERLNLKSGYKVDSWAPFVITAMHSLLKGAYDTLKLLCLDSTSICEEYRRQPLKLVEQLEAIQLDYKKQQQFTRVFDNNGDGLLGYEILNVQKSTVLEGKMIYEPVGNAFSTGELNIVMDKLTYSSDAAEASVCSTACPGCSFKTSESSQGAECSMASSFYFICGGLAAVILILILVIVYLIKRKSPNHATDKLLTDDGTSYRSRSSTGLTETKEKKWVSTTAFSGYASDYAGSNDEVILTPKQSCSRSMSVQKTAKGLDKPPPFNCASRYRNTSASSMGINNDAFVMDCSSMKTTKTKTDEISLAERKSTYQNDMRKPMSIKKGSISDTPCDTQPFYLRMDSQTEVFSGVEDLPDITNIKPNRGAPRIRNNSTSSSCHQDQHKDPFLHDDDIALQPSIKSRDPEVCPLPMPPDVKPPPVPTTPN